ncbi:MAG TPA: cyclopropane-fatty-acyl-phospholipid synthase family protein [Acidothermaceae bacterium]|nr:cyclopropane-fatty-acyl-phospholipid synthase family protein [Acidothermaceae bacterium]
MTTYELQPRQASRCVQAPAGPWTQLPAVPHAPIHAAIARRIFMRAAARLGVTVQLPDGRLLVKPPRIDADATATPVMRLHRPAQFFRRLGHDGLIGLGESYMAGDWDADDVASVLTPFARRMAGLVPGVLQRARRWYDARQPASEHNDLRGSKSNISRHYDLSNELFALFLDRTMTYSSAIWDEQRDGEALATAQIRKIDRLLDLAQVKAGTRLLEIGTGWGELAVRAAGRGATVTTVTLSREQQAWAIRRAELAGVGDLVDVQLRDYREVSGTYDAVVSVEMIEAVGLEYWPDYFATIDRVLAPRGRVALQSITIEHQRLLATKGTYTWIHKYVFPGGIIPSLHAVRDVVAHHTRLQVSSATAYGHDYARTLHSWLERFHANTAAVQELGFDERFTRMWKFYLAYCEAGFASGYLNVHQLVLER